MSAIVVRSNKLRSLLGYLQLMRPANITTAWADILLGCAAAGVVANINLAVISWLILATTGLYGGGVVFNDVCDAQLDTVERPERPIPSGRVSKVGAIALGTILLTIGVVAAAMVSNLSAWLASSVAVTALIYDRWGKHHYLSPLNRGLCRGGNLLLGISAVPHAVINLWYLALIPIVYIAAITAISRGEVHGGKKITGVIAIALVMVVIGSIFGISTLEQYKLLVALPFLGLFTATVVPTFIKAAIDPSPALIQTAVKVGVLSLIILDATIAAGFNGWYGLLISILLPLSRRLSRIFAVT